MRTPGQLALLEKNELIKELDSLFDRWKKKLSDRAQVSLNSVLRWANGTTQHSFKIEKAARQLINEEEQIRAMFPERAAS